jgi:phosphomannomutase
MSIKFGTDGWRAIVSDDFTLSNLRLVGQALAEHALSVRDSPTWVVGYDTRFLSGYYAETMATVLAQHGLHVILSDTYVPTPALSFAVKRLRADGGVMITASHNPPQYNGVKIKTAAGGPAGPAVTRDIEERISAILQSGTTPLRCSPTDSDRIQRLHLTPDYLLQVQSLIDPYSINAWRPNVLVDAMYGSGQGCLRTLLGMRGCSVSELHSELNPGFGGILPEPIERNLLCLQRDMRDSRWTIGLALDGDADRIGAMAPGGRFVGPQTIFALVLRYLVERRHKRGAIVKTVSTTQMINRLARQYDLPVYETPVGFDHICALFKEDSVLMGGEESGGISIREHIPDGDGILMGMLLVDALCTGGSSLEQLLIDLRKQVGPFCYARHDSRTEAFSKADLVRQLMASAPDRIAGFPVETVGDLDGVKYVLQDDCWLLIRPSGTEPMLRFYAEAHSDADVKSLLEAGLDLVHSRGI